MSAPASDERCVCQATPKTDPTAALHESWCGAARPTVERLAEVKAGTGRPLKDDELWWLRGDASRAELHISGAAAGAFPLTDDLPGFVVELAQKLGAVVAELDRTRAKVERLTAVEANARKLVSAWLRASAEHISISNLDAVRDTPLIAGMQDGRANQYSDCANELRDVLDGEDPDGFEFGVSVQVTAESEDALAEREFAAEAGHGATSGGAS